MLEDGWLWEISPMTATTPTTAQLQVNDAFLLLPDPYHCRCHRSYICHSDFTFKSTAQRLDIHHIGGELSLHHTANGLFNWQHWVHLQKSWQNCIQESVVGFCWSKYISSCKEIAKTICKRRHIDFTSIGHEQNSSPLSISQKKLGQFEKNCISRASEKVIVTFFDHRPFWPYSSCRSGWQWPSSFLSRMDVKSTASPSTSSSFSTLGFASPSFWPHSHHVHGGLAMAWTEVVTEADYYKLGVWWSTLPIGLGRPCKVPQNDRGLWKCPPSSWTKMT